MAQSFKETAHLKTDLNKYGEGYDRIFGKKDSDKEARGFVVIDAEAAEAFRQKGIEVHPEGHGTVHFLVSEEQYFKFKEEGLEEKKGL